MLERENRARHLIKDFRHSVIDLQWALHAPILAVLDSNANLYLYQVDEACSAVYDPAASILHIQELIVFRTKFLNIIRDEGAAEGHQPKFTWCPYMAGEGDSEAQQQYLIAVANVSVPAKWDGYSLRMLRARKWICSRRT